MLIGTDCIGSCKSNYHTITTTTSPLSVRLAIHSMNHIYMLKKTALTIKNRPSRETDNIGHKTQNEDQQNNIKNNREKEKKKNKK